MAEQWNDKNYMQETDDDEVEIDLGVLFYDFIKGCKKFWKIIVILIGLCGVSAVLISFLRYDPAYRSETTFTVTTNTSSNEEDSFNFYYDHYRSSQLEKTFPYILESQVLLDAVARELDVEKIEGTLTAESVSKSNLVTMYADSPNPEESKELLEAALKVYPDVSRFVIGKTRFHIIDAPNLPEKPYNAPNYLKISILGAFLGLIIGFAIAACYAFFRKTVHKSEELEEAVDVSCLASLPRLSTKIHKEQTNTLPSILQTNAEPAFAENMESLRLRVQSEMDKNRQKILLVTSTAEEEGKSLVAANLAFKLAQSEKKVLLIDANLRKQNLGRSIGMLCSCTLSDAARNKCDPIECVAYDQKSGIFFCGGRQPVENPSEILSHILPKVLEEVKDHVDYIILDAPASGEYEDVLLMQDYTDAILYVVMQEYASKNQILETLTSLDSEETPVIGYVFNGAEGGFGGSYGYGYGKYGYGYGKYGYGGSKYGYGQKSHYGYGTESKKVRPADYLRNKEKS